MRRKPKSTSRSTLPDDMRQSGHVLFGRGRQTPAPDAATSGGDSPRRKRTWLRRTVLMIVALALLATLWVGGKFVLNGVKIFGWNGFISLLTTNKLKGEDSGRVNILLAGNSADDPGHNGADLTDSIMLLSINTRERKGYVMSIPRDLYVRLPNSDKYVKINEVYQAGQKSTQGLPSAKDGGMRLLQQVVSERFGIEAHYSALINYTALQRAVDAVGGIQITVKSTDDRGLFDPSPDLNHNYIPLVQLPNGTVQLDGRQALNLARARGHADGSYGYDAGDFVRTEHQRQILIGLREKSTSAATLSNPVRLGQLVDSFGDNIQTDMKLGEFRRLFVLTKPIPSGQLASAGLDDDQATGLLEPYINDDGQYTLVPRAGVDDYSQIRDYLQQLGRSN
jgi:LCP family protein required for cell wall assembly